MRSAWTLLATLVLAGCVAIPGPSSVRTGDSTGQVRARLGAPAAERTLGSGDVAWYYVTGPSGFDTWRVVFGRDGAVSEYAQVLTARNFTALREAITRDAALDLLGPPMQRMTFARTATETWSYRWRDVTLEMIADVVFEARSGAVRDVWLYRDPAYSSTPSGPHR